MLTGKRVAIVVLGDVGRSPRMQYHAAALASQGAFVDLIGESGTPVIPQLADNPRIACHLLAPARAAHERRGLLFYVASAARLARQSLTLLYILLFRLRAPDVILAQTPPALPTLMIAAVAARCRRSRLIIDWHNFGFSLIALQLGAGHVLVRAARAYERRLAPLAKAHLCVSRTMRDRLREDWGLEATLLYDEPAEQFAPTPEHMRADILTRILAPMPFVPFDWRSTRRPALIVTATSWTADEDIGLLLDAAAKADRALKRSAAHGILPDLFILITGAGRLRQAAEERIRRLKLERVHVHTVWLSPQDYPRLLGAADLGVSLHRSASGVDLPMKIADMFGAGLPVCALNYGSCITERIDHGHNGLLFSTADELAAQWLELFRGFPLRSPLLQRLHRGVAASASRRWIENWREQAAPLFHRAALRPDDK
jgi:beta-1,4-mannosyltransferase